VSERRLIVLTQRPDGGWLVIDCQPSDWEAVPSHVTLEADTETEPWWSEGAVPLRTRGIRISGYMGRCTVWARDDDQGAVIALTEALGIAGPEEDA
jgi:hypothetical protein